MMVNRTSMDRPLSPSSQPQKPLMNRPMSPSPPSPSSPRIGRPTSEMKIPDSPKVVRQEPSSKVSDPKIRTEPKVMSKADQKEAGFDYSLSFMRRYREEGESFEERRGKGKERRGKDS